MFIMRRPVNGGQQNKLLLEVLLLIVQVKFHRRGYLVIGNA